MTRARILAGLALAGSLVLTGCSSVPALNGGLAARIGDDTVTMKDATDVAASYCSAIETQLADGQTIAQSVVNSQVVGSLAIRAAAEQFAAEQGVTPHPSFEDAEETLRANIADLTPEQQEAVLEVNLAAPYVEAVQRAVGEQEAGASDPDAALEAGQQAFAAWLDDQEVRIDPRFPITLADGSLAPADPSISFAVSDTATKGSAREPDQEFAAGLPSSQRCG